MLSQLDGSIFPRLSDVYHLVTGAGAICGSNKDRNNPVDFFSTVIVPALASDGQERKLSTTILYKTLKSHSSKNKMIIFNCIDYKYCIFDAICRSGS